MGEDRRIDHHGAARHELEAFLTLAEELHFGRTAMRLHVSTARISQTIRSLELRVGTRLFARTSRRVSLSPDGQQLLNNLRRGRDQPGCQPPDC
ncbi:LysR family transcriptional regulator [Dactylosporangium sp. NPDC000521]|uniref:LysR family transcriptional regulator n=1 Tax=Dactylosporangium sp. NPDC000521 TaxID=3363975 RepID=UPI0036A613E5